MKRASSPPKRSAPAIPTAKYPGQYPPQREGSRQPVATDETYNISELGIRVLRLDPVAVGVGVEEEGRLVALRGIGILFLLGLARPLLLGRDDFLLALKVVDAFVGTAHDGCGGGYDGEGEVQTGGDRWVAVVCLKDL